MSTVQRICEFFKFHPVELTPTDSMIWNRPVDLATNLPFSLWFYLQAPSTSACATSACTCSYRSKSGVIISISGIVLSAKA